MLAIFPEVEESTLSKEVLGELPKMVAIATEEEPWTLYFDGSSTLNGRRSCVVLINPKGQATTLSFKLNFLCTNNVVEYQAFVMGLFTAKEMGIEKIKIIGDSKLVLSQLQMSFAMKEATLAPYRTTAERLVNSFKQVVLEHIPRVTNRYVDALATLGSKLLFVEEQPNFTVIKKEHASSQSNDLGRVTGRKRLEKACEGKVRQGSNIKDLKNYAIIFGELYRQLSRGILTRCIGMTKARKRLQELHEATCILEPIISLYQRLQRYFWPEMTKQAAEIKPIAPSVLRYSLPKNLSLSHLQRIGRLHT